MSLIKTRYSGVYYRESSSKQHKGKPDRCFYIKYYKNKKQLKEAIGWLSDGYSAQYALQERNKRMDKQIKSDDTKYTFKQAMALYLDWAKDNKKTWRDDENRYNYRIADYFDNFEIDSIKTSDVHKFIAHLKKSGTSKGSSYTPQTIKHYVIIIRRVFNFMIDTERYLGTNPAKMSKVKLERFDNTRVMYLTDDEISRMKELFKDDTKVSRLDSSFVLFALYTGFRFSELCNLTWSNVDLQRGTVYLTETKGKRNYVIPLSKNALEVLNSVEPNDTEYVFVSSRGCKRNDFRKAWEKIKRLADIRPDVNFHDIRHTFGTIAVTSGVPLDVLQQLMTHKDIKTTQRYAHIVGKRYQEATSSLDNAFDKL